MGIIKQRSTGERCGIVRRITLSVVLLICINGLLIEAAYGNSSKERFVLSIPSTEIDVALVALARETGRSLIIPSEGMDGQRSMALNGTYLLSEALSEMLNGTSLTGGLTQSGVITISPTMPNFGQDQEKVMQRGKRNKFLSSVSALFFGAATVTGAYAQDGEAVDAAAEESSSSIDEIVVTASRRAESIRDAALSITAIREEDMARRNLAGMDDYLRSIPGANYIEVGLGSNAVIMRGVGIDPESEATISSATTGIYFGEVSLTGLGALAGAANLRMIDLERVEVLRGPQGTTFGAGSLAGVVRNIPNAPKLDEFEGKIKVGYSNTAEEGDDNTHFEGVLNVPLIEDKLAIRAVGYRQKDRGFIKNIAGTQLATNGIVSPGVLAEDAAALWGGAELYLDEDHVGDTTYAGGRISALFEPTENLSFTLTHVYQDAEQEGQPYVELGLSDNPYTQVTLALGDGEGVAGKESGYEDKIHLTNLVAEFEFGWGSVLSSSSWIKEEGARVQDQSHLGGFALVQIIDSEGKQFSQEVRAVSDFDGPFQFIAGAIYEDVERTSGIDSWSTTDETDALLGGPYFVETDRLVDTAVVSRFHTQLAFYGELSYGITEQFELTVGLRHFDYERGSSLVSEGFFGPRDLSPAFDEKGTNLKANLSYKPREDLHIYAQWAEGFRLGNAQTLPSAATCDVDDDGILDGTNAPIRNGFDSDTAENYELGAKVGLLEGRMQVNAAVYRVNWIGIPLWVGSGDPCWQGTTVNAGEARSQGLEIETTFQVTDGLLLNFGGAYTNAELTKESDSLSAPKGARLSSFPEYSINIGFLYEFPGIAQTPTYLRGDYTYVGDFYSLVDEEGIEMGDYGQLNIGMGVDINDIRVELYGTNVTNEDAITHGSTSANDSRAFRMRPRTIGVNASFVF